MIRRGFKKIYGAGLLKLQFMFRAWEFFFSLLKDLKFFGIGCARPSRVPADKYIFLLFSLKNVKY